MKIFSWFTFDKKDQFGKYLGSIIYGIGGIAPFRKCYEYYRPCMKGGHRHNYIYNACHRKIFRGKNARRIDLKDKKFFVKIFWENVMLGKCNVNKILTHKTAQQGKG